MQGSAGGFIKMTENNKGGKSLDFSADLQNSSTSKFKKTTVTLDDEIACFLEGRIQHICIYKSGTKGKEGSGIGNRP